MLDHKLHTGPANHRMPTVGRIDFDQFDIASGIHPLEQPFRFAIGRPSATDVKKIFRSGVDQRRFGRAHHQVIGMVHSDCNLTKNILLRILRPDRF